MRSSERIQGVDLAPLPDLTAPYKTPKTLNAAEATASKIPKGALTGSLFSVPMMELTVPAAVVLFVSPQDQLLPYLIMAAGDVFSASMRCTATTTSPFSPLMCTQTRWAPSRMNSSRLSYLVKSSSPCETVACVLFDDLQKAHATNDVEYIATRSVAQDEEKVAQLLVQLWFRGGTSDLEEVADAADFRQFVRAGIIYQ
ncbi:hypothetical protein HPB50_013796 [Hyalomma asiaticum]|uniref:Uncharacterized protein n=1 Tax=Hyalomma asiaticum TaxID=266040 RepID=A0ACB7TK73_HYAAI|nr:hypothetical protein HPB50_013796 [Hyalomma asiaticum]